MTLRIFIIFSLLFLFLLSGCSKKQEPKANNSLTVNGSRNVAEVINVTKRAGKVPNFSWKDASGKTIDFDQFRGKVTLVNFWATWCGPCKRELPDLIALSKEMADKNVKVIGISTDRGSNVIEDVRRFVSEKDIPYQIVISNEDLEEAFGNIRVIPTTFLIGADGNISQTIIGARSKEIFMQEIVALLK